MTNNDLITQGIVTLFANIQKQHLNKVDIRFSTKFDHVIDRFKDRSVDMFKALTQLRNLLYGNVCQVVFYCYLEDRPLRLNLKTSDYVFGFTCSEDAHGKVLKFRTIIDNGPTRRDSRISVYTIQ
jgi:hypothetical protein